MNTNSRIHKTTAFCGMISFALLCGIAGCNDSLTKKWEKHDQIYLSASQSLPYAVLLEEQFPDCVHFIDSYGSTDGLNTWKTTVFFGGRYELCMAYKVKIDYNNGNFVPESGPVFYLHEVSSIDIARRSIKFSEQWTFGSEDFEKLIENEWDFASIGIRINPEEVDGFDWYRTEELGKLKVIRLAIPSQ